MSRREGKKGRRIKSNRTIMGGRESEGKKGEGRERERRGELRTAEYLYKRP